MMRDETETPHPSVNPPPEGERHEDTVRSRKVLIADDDQLLVERLKVALEGRGYQVFATIDGTEALDYTRRDAPDYLVLDLLTPTVDGLHLYQHLKEDPRFRSLPLILLAGTDPELAAWLRDVKAHAYIAKRGAEAILEDLFLILQAFEEGTTPPIWTQETGGLDELKPLKIVTELLAYTPHLNALLHNLEEGVLLLDPSHRIVYVNPAGAGLLKRHERDLLGAPLSRIFDAEDDESFLEVLGSLARREGLATERLTYAYKEDTFHITITNLLGEGGNSRQLLLIKDVSRSLRRIQELAALNDLSSLLTSTLDLNELLRLIMERTEEFLGVEASSLLLKEDDTDELVFQIGLGEYGTAVVGRRLKVGQGIAGWVFEHGSPLMVPDVRQDRRFYQGVDYDTGFTTRSLICVPLKTREKVIGAIQVLNSPADPPFTQDDVNLLSAIAAHAATAIDQARLFQETRTRAEKLGALNDLSSLLTSTLDLQDLLHLIMQRIQNFLGVEASSLLLKDDEKDELVIRIGVGDYGAEVVGRRLKVGQGIAGWVFEQGTPLLVADVRKDGRFYQGVDYDTGFKTRSVVCVPLMTREKVIGVIQVLNSPSNRPFNQDDVNLLSTLAAHAATAIENARLFQETQTRAEKVGALAEVSQAVTSSLDLQHVFELVIRATSELLDAPVASLWTLEGDDLILREGRGIYSELWDRHFYMVEQLAAWIVQQREPVVVREFADDPRIKEMKGAPPRELHACAGFPLRIAKRCLGVLMLFRTSPDPFQREDVEFLSAFANQAAVVIEHARLYQELQSRSANLQQVVRHRTAEFERKSLDLDQANQAKSEFLVTMCHELKTSLGVVVAFSQLLEQQPPGFLNEKQAKYVTNIMSGARHVLALINNIVDLSTVDAEKLELHPEVIKVPEMLLSVLADLRPQADEKGIQFSVDVKKCPPKIMADRHRLRQILDNLLSNAVRFTPKGGRIAVEAKSRGEVAELSVTDTGIGIKTQDLERVFDRFAQFESASKEHRGTRLGLALTKHLVELHGGTIRAKSRGRGRGSTFTITLPLRSSTTARAQSQPPSGRQTPSSGESVPRPGESVPRPGESVSGPMVVFSTTFGELTIELYPDKAPLTVENFLAYVDAGFYDGTVFHRVVPGFVIQGGGFTEKMEQKQTRPPIKNEADNGLKNERGTLSMVRTKDVNSATSEFFINLTDNPLLDHGGQDLGYAVFGRVIRGMDVVEMIAAVPITNRGKYENVPVEPVLIRSARQR